MADPTRRAIIERLSRGEARVTEVAEPFHMSLNAVSKHIRVQEASGVIERHRKGRDITVELHPRGDETDLVLTHERLPTPAIHDGHTRGWGNILHHLADAASKDL